ncbi:hypothetical protein NDU88_004357 [Pleurodeles waltl]|uniref:Reverse transcriptase domain-containing protein n=1 Tax=Pleurodeles waltl TaxID=8319 RepID=A0AAV7V3C1_PLEWA|nr:hypothetical protein NDU88_004357 [Pleurodeles waltl]
MYEEAERQGSFPNEIDQATIVVIPKTQPPSRYCSAYRPISLLNTEIKVLSTILASRLREVMPTLIHPDQCGFMPTRSTRHCIRRLHLALAHHRTLSHTPLALLLLDFEKAFDTVDWSFLDQVLQGNGLGPKSRGLVRLLYSNPTARVQVNGVVSDPFPIGRGTRQGCPLSPLLFALTIEPLAILLREDPLIEGWSWPACPEDRIALYADDVLLYISNPAKSGPRVLQILSLFAEASGLILNPNKSLLVPLHRSRDCVDWQHNIPVRRNSFKYLGIHISLLPELTWELNMTPLTKRIRTDLQRWKTLPLNLLGRIALYKMMILPRVLYLLQNFPHPIPKRWFSEMDSLARQFMWNDTRPRLALKTCQRDVYDGGLGMSNIHYYLLAMHLLVINDWVGGGWSDPAYRLELRSLGYPRIFDTLYGGPISRDIPEVTKVILLGWQMAQKLSGWWGRLTQRTTLWHGKHLKEVVNLEGFQKWDNIGISTLGDVWEGSHMRSFGDLQRLFSLNRTQFHKYL